jgi:hypothetical protein
VVVLVFVVAVGGFGLVRVVPVRKNSFVLRELWECGVVRLYVVVVWCLWRWLGGGDMMGLLGGLLP